MKKSELIKIIKEEVTSILLEKENANAPEGGVYTYNQSDGTIILMIPDMQKIKQAFRSMLEANVQTIKNLAANRGYTEIQAPKLGTLDKETGQAMVYGKYNKGAQ